MDKIIKMRREIANIYSKKLSKIDGISVPKPLEGSEHVYQLYTIRLKDNSIRNGLMQHLITKGISCKVYFEPVHLSKYYQGDFGCKEGDLPVTERISTEVLTLPMYPGLSREKLDYIIDCIQDYFEKV